METDFIILGDEDLLGELRVELDGKGLSYEQGAVIANSADGGFSPMLAVLLGGALASLTHILVAFIKRGQGQRKIVFQIQDSRHGLRRIEIETPDFDEVEKLLRLANEALLVEEMKPEQRSSSKETGKPGSGRWPLQQLCLNPKTLNTNRTGGTTT